MKTTATKRSSVSPPGLARRVLVGAASVLAIHAAQAGPGAISSTDILGLPKQNQVFYANSPSGMHTVMDPVTGATSVVNSGVPLRKFVDPLPGVDAVNNCGPSAWALVNNSQAGSVAAPAPKGTTQSCIPLAVPDTTTYPGSDYYVIGVVEYAQQMHSDLPKATALRGYTQLNNPSYPATQAAVADPQNAANPPITTYTAWPQPHYLGPIIIAAKDRPVRVKYVNLLPTGRATFATNPACEIITNNGTSTAIASTDGAPSFYISPGSDSGAGVPADGKPHTYCETITNAPVATARNGDLMIPNDLTVRGGGAGQNEAGAASCAGYAPNTLPGVLQANGATNPNYNNVCLHTLNRANVHLHGGLTPWISDGHPHQWVVPQLEADPAALPQSAGGLGRYGESYHNVPDMPDPGPGAGTLYWTNQQTARLMFYHDHTSGMTRTNVYVGEAAGYVLRDPVEATLEQGGTITPAATSGLAPVSLATGVIPAVGVPLVIEDKTFVPADIANEDALWSPTWWGAPGDLWYPHVYEPNQDPTSITGSNNAGRWDYGQWFFPPMSAASLRGPVPQPSLVPEGFMDTPVINGTAYPTVTVPAGLARFRILSVPNERTLNLSWFVADSTQQGVVPVGAPVGTTAPAANTEVKMLPATTAPAATVPPVALQACSVSNLDGTLFGGQPMPVLDLNGQPLNGNGLPVNGVTISAPTKLPGGAPLPPGFNHFLQANVVNTPGAPVGTVCWPASWPTDGRDGGVPDPTLAGPAWVQIGTEGGFLPQPQIIPPTPLGYEYNRRSVTVLNAYYHGLYVGPAERVDVLVDFSPYAGKTLILYNDSPAPNPGFDARNDYYTGDVDQTANGGAQTTLAGYGPNTRTLMQVVVGNPASPPLGTTATPMGGATLMALASSYLPAAFAANQSAPLVGEPGFSPAFPAAASKVFGAQTAAVQAALTAQGNANAFIQQYGRIGDTAMTYWDGTAAKVTAAQAALPTAASPGGQPAGDLLEGAAAIHELFDTDYGRMNSVLGYELPLTNFLTQTTVPLAYVDPATDMFKEGETQVWKITHNGVDTHAIHFHLLNLQVVNRVGWDGTIRPPDPDEVGWKESIKMNPLEDIYVAFKAVKPMLPFNLPDSSRRLDPTQATTSTANFTNPPAGEYPYIPTLTCATNTTGAGNVTTPGCQPLYGLAGAAQQNVVANFGWEYVWHCHLLGHEENDMMRPLVMSVGSVIPTGMASGTATPQAAVAATATTLGVPAGMNVGWADPTPIAYNTAAGWPYVALASTTTGTIPVGTTVNLGSAANEIGFNIYRVDLGTCATPDPTSGLCPAAYAGTGTVPAAWAAAPASCGASPIKAVGLGTPQTTWCKLGSQIANATSFVDINAFTNEYYAYAITAYNQAGESAPVMTGIQLMTTPNGPPLTPLNFIATPNLPLTPPAMALAWTMDPASPPATGFTLLRCVAATVGGTCVPAPYATVGAVTSYADNVAVNTTYGYQIYASNPAGVSALSAIVYATTPNVPPVAPTAVSFTATSGTTGSLAWTNPAANATGLQTFYCLGTCTAAGPWTLTTPQPAGLATSDAVTGLTAGATYTFAVAAYNNLGTSNPAYLSPYALSAPVTMPATPNAVTGLAGSATPTTPSAVTLTWTNPVQGPGQTPTGLVVTKAIGAATPTTVACATPVTPTSTTCVDNAVTNGTAYTYTVTVSNLAGSAPASIGVTVLPSAASAVLFTPTSGTTGTLTWTNPVGSNNTSAVTQYCLGACTAAGPWTNTGTQPAGMVGPLAVSGLTHGATYTFAVAEYGPLGTTVGSPLALSAPVQMPLAPAVVTGLTATANPAAPAPVTVAWTNPTPTQPSQAATGLVVQRATITGGVTGAYAAATCTPASTTTSTSCVDNNVTAGTSYVYQVYQFNLDGFTAPPATSNAVTTTITIAGPTGLTATALAYNRIGLSFTNQATNETGFPIYRTLAVGGVCPAPLTGYTQIATAPTARGVVGTVVNYTDTTVGPGTQYCYAVTAINGLASSSPATGPASATTPAPAVAAPTGLTSRVVAGATAGAGPTVRLNWNWTQVAGDLPLTGFEISRFNGTAWVIIGTVAGGTRAFTDTAPVQGSVNQYQVVAYNLTAGIQTNSAIASVSATVGTLPTVPAATLVPGATGSRSITVDWTPAGTTAGATAVAVQRATNATFTTGLATRNVGTTAVATTFTGLTSGTTYYFRVRMTNASGFVYSTVVSVAAP